ncbi:hypothetical protein N752_05080 [Desulforamulus aquiferis]|nr:hypothetical protein [Desulforamulus aquiferis]RYD06266.1 hypothetical protein N752_05080 [Desulforamulus aquiferis]
MNKPLQLIARVTWLMLGLFIFSFSLVMLIEAKLGLSPWDVLHLGITYYLPFTFGQVIIGTGLLCVAIAYPLGIKPSSATIINMFFVGIFVDLIAAAGWVVPQESYLGRWVYLALGVLGCGLVQGYIFLPIWAPDPGIV